MSLSAVEKPAKQKWRDANPEKYRVAREKWLAATVEKRREAHRKWRDANPEKYRAEREKASGSWQKWRDANPEKVHAARKKWEAANADKLNAARTQREAASPELRARSLASKKKWRAANPEKLREQQRKWRAANPEKARARWTKWEAANPGAHARKVSGNWPRYCASLLKSKTAQRELLTTDQLMGLLEQQSYKCALTGMEMTCIRGQGRVPTNASIDRINAGSPYTIDNIQLVCSNINSWRGDCSLSDFIDACCLIAVCRRSYKPPDLIWDSDRSHM